jgi:hypothetical protein
MACAPGLGLDEGIVAAHALARGDEALDALLDFLVDLARQWLARMLLAQDFEQAAAAIGCASPARDRAGRKTRDAPSLRPATGVARQTKLSMVLLV